MQSDVVNLDGFDLKGTPPKNEHLSPNIVFIQHFGDLEKISKMNIIFGCTWMSFSLDKSL